MIPALDYSTLTWDMERMHQWEMINSMMAWAIRRARCARVFAGMAIPLTDIFSDFWSELIRTLHRQFDELMGGSDRMQ